MGNVTTALTIQMVLQALIAILLIVNGVMLFLVRRLQNATRVAQNSFNSATITRMQMLEADVKRLSGDGK